MFTLLSHISTCNICINFIIPTQRINSNFLGSVSSGGSGFAFPFPFPFLTRVLLRGALAGLFCFSWDGAAVVVVLAIAPAGWPSNNRKKYQTSISTMPLTWSYQLPVFVFEWYDTIYVCLYMYLHMRCVFFQQELISPSWKLSFGLQSILFTISSSHKFTLRGYLLIALGFHITLV